MAIRTILTAPDPAGLPGMADLLPPHPDHHVDALQVAAEFGTVDFLVNNAGITRDTPDPEDGRIPALTPGGLMVPLTLPSALIAFI